MCPFGLGQPTNFLMARARARTRVGYIYTFTLRVTDNRGSRRSDKIVITVVASR